MMSKIIKKVIVLVLLTERLGQRLESEGEHSKANKHAEICYVAAGKISKVVQRRAAETESSTDKLQVNYKH